MKKPAICIYHGNCADGFTAAWAVRRKLGEAQVEYFPGVYGNPPPDVKGRAVIMVDFSYKHDVMQKIIDEAGSLLVLDHHVSARQELGAIRPNGYTEIHFDMERSGAMMAWNHFFHNEPVPRLVQYVQDRDLWKFELPASREVAAYVSSWPYAWEQWTMMHQLMEVPDEFERIIAEGTAILRKQRKDIAELLDVNTRWIEMAGSVIPVANMPYTLASDAAHELCKRFEPAFAACYFDRKDCRQFSLRSLNDGADVSKIARSYGGGGHVHAAGFQMPHNWLGEGEPSRNIG